ncbi:anti-lipopolysaccharide factor-like [Saccoglossus kowalevskii]
MSGTIDTIITINDLINKLTGDAGEVSFHNRTIRYEVKGRLHKLKWVYDGTAWDLESGTSVKARHYQSQQGAKEHAVRQLIDELKKKGIL